jgi:uncharacterized protein (DUF433 family)
MATRAPGARELIAEHIEQNPSLPGAADVRIRGHGVPVWALIGQHEATGRDAAAVARAYRIPRAAMDAALAYYRQHRAVIQARIDANAA